MNTDTYSQARDRAIFGHTDIFVLLFCVGFEQQYRVEIAPKITWLRKARIVATKCAIGRDGCES